MSQTGHYLVACQLPPKRLLKAEGQLPGGYLVALEAGFPLLTPMRCDRSVAAQEDFPSRGAPGAMESPRHESDAGQRPAARCSSSCAEAPAPLEEAGEWHLTRVSLLTDIVSLTCVHEPHSNCPSLQLSEVTYFGVLCAQEAALDKTISIGTPEQAGSGDSMPSKHMLTWAQHTAQAARSDSTSSIARRARSQGTLSDQPADSIQAHEQPGQPIEAYALRQSAQSTSAGNGDPFAFDASAFGTGASAGEAQSREPMPPQPSAAAASSHADPFAFDMGAFGMASEPEPPSSADTQLQDSIPDPAAPALAPVRMPAAAQDPYAFDMGAFGMGGLSAVSAGGEAASITPAEAAHDQGGEAETAQEGGPAKPAIHADPYAFDMGSFGMSVDLPEPPKSSGMIAQNSGAHSSSPAADEAEQPRVPAALADPYAFDTGAFGMAPHTQKQPVDSTLHASAPEAEHQSSAARQYENVAGPAAHADPSAFDMGAFGMSTLTAPEETTLEHDSTGQSSAAPSADKGRSSAADPFAFDPDAFGMGMPGAKVPQDTDSESGPSTAAAQPSQQQNVDPSSLSSAQPARRALAGVQQAQQQRQQGLQQRQLKGADALQAAAGSLSLAPPEQEAFTPLTDAEVQQLERLLSRAAGPDDSSSTNGESALSCLSGTVSFAHTLVWN